MNEKLQGYKNTFQKRILELLKGDIFRISILSFIFYFFFLAAGGYLPDNDIYFHLKIADLYSRKIFLFKLPWEAYSIHADKYVDFHFLFHWLLVPFTTAFKNHMIAGAAAIAFYSTLSLSMLCILLKELNIRHRWMWVLFYLLASPIFTGRLLFGRGVIIFIGIIYAFIFFLLRKNHIALFVISWIAVWTYPGFPVLAVFAAIHTAALFLGEGGFREKDIRCLVLTLCGMAAGVIVHPSFPAQFYGYYLELVLQFARPADIELIAEWLPPDQMIVRTGLLMPIFVLLLRLVKIKRHSPLESTLLIFTVVIIISMTGSIKTYEYLIPFLTLYLAMNDWEEYRKIAVYSVFSISVILMLFWSLPQLYMRINVQKELMDPEKDFEAADWLQFNTRKDELILLSWGSFPKFFYRNDHNRYPFGLNPVYSYGHDREMYLLMRSFFEGKTANLDYAVKTLNAGYAVLNRADNREIIDILKKKYDPVFRNERYEIYRFAGNGMPADNPKNPYEK